MASKRLEAPPAGSAEYRASKAAGDTAFKDNRYADARGHFERCMAFAAENGEPLALLAETNFLLARCAQKLNESPIQHLKAAITAKSDHVSSLNMLSSQYEAQGEWQQAKDWLTLLVKHSPDDGHKARLAAASAEVAKGRQLTLNKLKYSDTRNLRYDVARLTAQSSQDGLRSGHKYFAIPTAWWDAFRDHVGGFETSKDIAAWMRIIRATGRADWGPTDPIVIQQYTVSGIADVLPETLTLTVRDEDAGVQARTAVEGTTPGPLDARSLLIQAASAGTGAVSDGLDGPRLRSGLVEGADFHLASEEVWRLLHFVYDSEGPVVARYVVPRVPHVYTDLVVDLWPELNRFTNRGGGDEMDEDGDEDVAVQSTSTAMAGLNLQGPAEGEADLEPDVAPAATARVAGQAACAVCARPSSNQCPNCKVVKYCSKECQRNSWAKHKLQCDKLKAAALSGGLTAPVVERNGKCGLNNLGNTCFMNSSLQALSSVWPLTQYFIRGTWGNDLNPTNPMGSKDNHLTKNYAGLMARMWLSDARAVSPSEFKASISRFQSRFSGFQQHDAQELLNFLLDGLHEDLNGVLQKPYVDDLDSNGRADSLVAALSWERYCRRNKSVLVDLFAAQLKSTLVCPHCAKVSVKFDPYWTVPLQIPQGAGLEQAALAPRTIEVYLSRLTWSPEDCDALRIPGTPGSGEAWAATRMLSAGVLPAVPAGEEGAVAADGSPAVGCSAAYTSKQRLERYVFTVPATVSGSPADTLLQQIEAQSGVPASRLIMQKLLQKDTSSALSAVDFAFAGSYVNVDKLNPPFKPSTLTAYSSTFILHVVEVADPSWSMPRELAVPRALEAWKGPDEEAARLEALSTAPFEDEGADLAFAAARDPCKRTLVLARVLVWKPASTGKSRTDALTDEMLHKSKPVDVFRDAVDVMPVIITAAVGMSVAQFRCVVARELFHLFGRAAKEVLARKQAGAQAEDVSDADALLYIASALHMQPVGPPGPAHPDTWLPRTTPSGEDAAPTPGALPGMAKSAHGTPVGEFVRLNTYRDDNSRYRRPSARTTDFLWCRVNVVVRGELATLAQAECAAVSSLPPKTEVVANAPSWVAGLSSLHALEKEKAEFERGGVRLSSCFDRLRREEVLDKDNMWFCSDCKTHVQANKTLELWSLPDFLVLQLKRFETRGFRANKLATLVDFPLRGLDLSPYHASQYPENVAFDAAAAAPEDVRDLLLPRVPPSPDNSLYDCVAVINHFGGAYGGHYTAYGNHDVGMQGAADGPGTWHEFNDSSVSEVAGQGRAVVSAGAYVLVYRRRKQLGRPL